MSLTGDRAAIAAALTAVDGVTGHTYRPTTARPGDAWPLLGALERAEASVFYVTWRVLVMLPQDERAASEWVDDRVGDLVDALQPHGFVDRIEPVALAASGSEQLGLQITMRSE